MLVKIPLTPARIELATFRFVSQHLNHCATLVPRKTMESSEMVTSINKNNDNIYLQVVCVEAAILSLCLVTP